MGISCFVPVLRYSSVWKGGLVLYCGKYGTVEKLGELVIHYRPGFLGGLVVDRNHFIIVLLYRFTMVFSETPDMSLHTETVSPRSHSPPTGPASHTSSHSRHSQVRTT